LSELDNTEENDSWLVLDIIAIKFELNGSEIFVLNFSLKYRLLRGVLGIRKTFHFIKKTNFQLNFFEVMCLSGMQIQSSLFYLHNNS